MKKRYHFSKITITVCILFIQMVVTAQKDVYLILGERNAQGRAEIEAEDEIALTEVGLYNGTTWEDAKNDSALAPDGGLNRYSSNQKAANDQKLNFAYAFGKMVNEVTGNEIGLVVSARAGADIEQWLKGTGGGYYEAALADLNAALLLEAGSTVKGILWCHGEADRNDSGYIADLTTLINDFRTDLGIADLPFIACEISKQRLDNATFNTNIKTITDSGDANYIANTDYVSSEGLQTISGSDQDYNSNSQRVLGYRYAAKVLEMAYGYTYVENHIMYITEDAVVRGGTNSGTPQEAVDDQVIRIKHRPSTPNNDRKGLMKFDVSSLTGTDDRIVVDATLKINPDTVDGDMDISFFDMYTGWDEDTVTLDIINSNGGFSTAITKSATDYYLDTGVLIHNGADLTEFIKDKYGSGTSILSLGLQADVDSSNDLEITSKDHSTDSALKPYIVVSYLESPVVSNPQTTKIAKLTFETDPTDSDPAISDISYTTSVVEYSDIGVGDAEDFFIRTKDGDQTGTNVASIYSYTDSVDLGDYFFIASDIDDGATYTPPLYLDLEEIDISNYENLEIRVYLASITGELNAAGTDPAAWDNNPSGGANNNDYVHFAYDIDNTGSYTNLLWVESQATDGSINEEPKIDTNFDGTGNGASVIDTFTQFKATIPATGNTLDIQIEFKMDNHGEDLAIDNIEIWGTLINDTCSGTVSTWNGSTWINGTPDISTPAVIDGDYTTNGTNGSFSACSLTINAGSTLTIEDDYYVEVENDVTVDGTLTVENHGNFVQNVDTASFTNSGTTSIKKNTEPLANWYDYTFWSSPVKDLTIGSGPLAISSMCYWFNADNYLDENTEIGNSGTFTVGYDHIDDDGDDWQYAGASTAMTAGLGFSATHSKSGFTTGIKEYEFIGEFNNGVITPALPIYYNAANAGGHWNLVGNPYPCALDFDAFVTNNPGVIEGVALVWSQATNVNVSAPGSQAQNFSQSDFLIMTSGSGMVNNAPGTLLEYIPSGQSFFIKGTANGTITFNNSMRIKNGASNAQFFRSSNTKNKTITQANKLWVNLTTDFGVFNQVLVAYVDGATNGYDGMSYDAPRNLSSGASVIYTQINEVDDTKYAIQGKNINSINEDEIIPLGFATLIESETIYTIAIDHLKGDFLSANSVYLKDSFLNKVHNLSESNYTFTSGAGEFNDRFEIAFNANLLSNDDIEETNNSLQVYYLDKHQVNFKVTNGLTIKQVIIYDLHGRNLYNYEGRKNSETYSLSKLNEAMYIAKIELSNGSVVTKKIIKNGR